jgi:hypothetical protein
MAARGRVSSLIPSVETELRTVLSYNHAARRQLQLKLWADEGVSKDKGPAKQLQVDPLCTRALVALFSSRGERGDAAGVLAQALLLCDSAVSRAWSALSTLRGALARLPTPAPRMSEWCRLAELSLPPRPLLSDDDVRKLLAAVSDARLPDGAPHGLSALHPPMALEVAKELMGWTAVSDSKRADDLSPRRSTAPLPAAFVLTPRTIQLSTFAACERLDQWSLWVEEEAREALGERGPRYAFRRDPERPLLRLEEHMAVWNTLLGGKDLQVALVASLSGEAPFAALPLVVSLGFATPHSSRPVWWPIVPPVGAQFTSPWFGHAERPPKRGREWE